MLLRRRAWDVMRDDFVRVEEDASLNQVIKVLNESQEMHPENNFVLVFSKKGKFLGAISMWNILQSMGPCLLKDVHHSKDFDLDKAFHSACLSCSEVKIKDVLQRDVPVIKPTEPLARIIEIFLDYRRGRAVVEEAGKVIGVVLLYDVYKEIARDVERW